MTHSHIDPSDGNSPIKINYGKALLTQDGGWLVKSDSGIFLEIGSINVRVISRSRKVSITNKIRKREKNK